MIRDTGGLGWGAVSDRGLSSKMSPLNICPSRDSAIGGCSRLTLGTVPITTESLTVPILSVLSHETGTSVIRVNYSFAQTISLECLDLQCALSAESSI